jgi:hypothetical protein
MLISDALRFMFAVLSTANINKNSLRTARLCGEYISFESMSKKSIAAA